MAAVNWPITLPQAPASFNETKAKNTITTEPDTGPSKTRRRFTKAKKTANMTFMLTIEQYNILDAFYANEMLDGTVGVNFLHPWRQQMVEMRMPEPPSASNEGNLGVNVTCKVEYF